RYSVVTPRVKARPVEEIIVRRLRPDALDLDLRHFVAVPRPAQHLLPTYTNLAAAELLAHEKVQEALVSRFENVGEMPHSLPLVFEVRAQFRAAQDSGVGNELPRVERRKAKVVVWNQPAELLNVIDPHHEVLRIERPRIHDDVFVMAFEPIDDATQKYQIAVEDQHPATRRQHQRLEFAVASPVAPHRRPHHVDVPRHLDVAGRERAQRFVLDEGYRNTWVPVATPRDARPVEVDGARKA